MKPEPGTLRRWPLLLYLLVCTFLLQASPARRGLVNLTQPDGSRVPAYLSGDEHGHLVTTADGCALIQDAEGWWCYARFDYYGTRLNTGVHAGAPDAPGEVIAASRDIPRDLLSRRRSRRTARFESIQARQRARTRRFLSEGSGRPLRHGLIILAQFQDLSFTYSRDDFENMVNGAGTNTVISYFRDQWKDACDFKFDITPVVTLPEGFAFYGGNNEENDDKNPDQLVIDACAQLGPEWDFSIYDNDGDGEVDNVFVFFAGPNEAEGAGENHVWPHMWYLLDGAGITYPRDGVLVNNYACTSELMIPDRYNTTVTTLASIGTFCHEYTHTFGIPDLYDGDDNDSGGYAEGMWQRIDLMDAGNYNDMGRTPPNYSAVERWHFGMGEGRPLTAGRHTLRPVHENNDFFYLTTDDESEIYLIECRRAKGWDAFIGGSGLLVYHIDWSERPAGESTSAARVLTARDRWMLNEVNNRPDHQCVDIIEADPTAPASYQAAMKNRNYEAIPTLAAHAFWPFGDANILTCDTDPAFLFWSGAESPLGLADITLNADGSVSFTAFNDLDEKAPAVKLDDPAVFQDAAILQWSAVDPTFEGTSILRWGLVDDTRLTEVEVTPYEAGRYACVLEGLKPMTAYKVQVLCRRGAIPGPVSSTFFTTKSDKKAGTWSYIYLKGVPRNSDGSFAPDTPLPLRVYNVPEADGVSWSFDGQAIAPGPDGYWHVARSGELKAVVHTGGNTEVLTKKIIVK